MPESAGFAFGANWTRFLRHVTEDRVHRAGGSLVDFMGLENLHDKTFLDVGCGSGLFSCAAFKLGAKRVVSFDTDWQCVECCKRLHAQAGWPATWEIYQASILDAALTAKLGAFDIVYAWGTLQHTGRMWEAMQRSAELVKPGGYLYVAVYNHVDGPMGSKFWRRFKQVFSALPRPAQFTVELAVIPIYFAARKLHARSLIEDVVEYESTRGMYWRTDLTDWLGGLPYEFATVDSVCNFVTNECGKFVLQNLKATKSLANNWYLFRKAE
jgi:2-polyprenyl-6-hydroxyphenyl methylase/3-demethylubiquinone-9 3-methyltransferase